MRFWRRWSEAAQAAALVAVVALVGGLGVWRSGGFTTPSLGLPDLLVGVTLVVVGAALRMRDADRVGWLIAAAGLTWYAGNFAHEPIAAVAWTADHLALVHRAFVFTALFTYPFGRVPSGLERLVVIGAFAGVLVVGAAGEEWWMIVWASGLCGTSAVLVLRRPGLLRAGGIQVLPVLVLFWSVLVATATMLLAWGTAPPPRATVLTYQAGIVATALFLLDRAVEWRRRTADVANAVVEITLGPGGDVTQLLSRALRDPTIEVAFAVPTGDATSWVDEAGRPVARLTAADRSVVPIVVDGDTIAEVASTVDLEPSPTLLAAVASAMHLAADHARLRADLRTELGRLAASRQRLLVAADRERSELAGQLEREAGQTLQQIRTMVAGISASGDHSIVDAVLRSADRLAGVERDLASLAAGLGPAALTGGGLEPALHDLADGGIIPVRVAVEGPLGAVPPAIASTLYFVCAEGIANAIKHAGATSVDLTLSATDDRWSLRVVDDGGGGAQMAAGSGLQRLADRVGALGGRLHVESALGSGTRLTVELPRG